MNLGLDGRHALVTGGTRGVGRAISLALAAAGASVLACYRDDVAAAAELAGCHLLRADLCTADGRARALAAVRARFGGLDILVNNFGTYAPAPLAAMAAPELERSLHANLSAHVLLTQALLPVLRDGAAVVNIGAGMAERGRPDHVAFTTAKAGLRGFTRSLSKELAPRGVRVNTVAPGVVETERGLDLPPPVREGIRAAIPLRRFARPADVASLVVFLASDLACSVVGATLRVDGGI